MSSTSGQPMNKPSILSILLLQQTSNYKQTQSYISIVVLIIAILYFSFDVVEDITIEQQGIIYITIEAMVFLSILLVLWFEISRVIQLSSKVQVTEEKVTRLRKQIHTAIHEEFESWGLTETEKNIALMLIKGLSMKEIAEVRGVKEKSVRQQATGIYTKSGLANRYELTSHFIESFFLTDIPINGS